LVIPASDHGHRSEAFVSTEKRDRTTEIAAEARASAQSQALIRQKCLGMGRISNPVGAEFGLFRLTKPARLQAFH
jgi:hypothetical protein